MTADGCCDCSNGGRCSPPHIAYSRISHEWVSAFRFPHTIAIGRGSTPIEAYLDLQRNHGIFIKEWKKRMGRI